MKRKFAILLALISLFCAFNVNSFADGLDIACSTTANEYIKSKYGLDNSAGDWKCGIDNSDGTITPPDGFPYTIKVQVPVKRACTVDKNGKRVGDCDADTVVANGTIGTITEAPISGSTNTKITATIAGSMTIYSKKQLDMYNVDINIADGRVVITGIENDDDNAWNNIYEKYKFFINGFTGLCILTCVLVFIISAIKLGSVAGNPTERKRCMTAMLMSGIGTAGLGAVVIMFSFFMNLL